MTNRDSDKLMKKLKKQKKKRDKKRKHHRESNLKSETSRISRNSRASRSSKISNETESTVFNRANDIFKAPVDNSETNIQNELLEGSGSEENTVLSVMPKSQDEQKIDLLPPENSSIIFEKKYSCALAKAEGDPGQK